MINIIDNLIKESQENYLEELFLSAAFPWFYQKSTIDQGGAKHFLT